VYESDLYCTGVKDCLASAPSESNPGFECDWLEQTTREGERTSIWVSYRNSSSSSVTMVTTGLLEALAMAATMLVKAPATPDFKENLESGFVGR